MVEGKLKNINELKRDKRAAMLKATTNNLLFNISSKDFKLPENLD